MKILIAEDDEVSRLMLEATLVKWGHDTTVVTDGEAAWAILQQPEAPSLAILDWMMPGLDGPEICRRLRQLPEQKPTHVILLTTKSRKEDLVAGLEAGADDYITKPFDRGELKARLEVGVRLVDLQHILAARVCELEEALSNNRQLRGLLPICSYCKKIRSDGNYWQQIESYIREHTDTDFSHGICPECYTTEVRPQLEKIKSRKRKQG